MEFLATQLAVSEMTIRRDLASLAKDGLLIRSHGGASAVESVKFEFHFLDRAQQRRREKDAIGERAAQFIRPGQSVLLDSGTTTLAAARQLRHIAPLTAITTSLPIASVMQRAGNAEILLLGGFLRRESPDLEGPLTESNLDTLRADVALLGADGVGLDGTVYNGSLTVGRLLSKAVRAAAQVFVLADSSKIGRTALSAFGSLTQFAGLITDDGISPDHLAALTKNGVKVMLATVPAPATPPTPANTPTRARHG